MSFQMSDARTMSNMRLTNLEQQLASMQGGGRLMTIPNQQQFSQSMPIMITPQQAAQAPSLDQDLIKTIQQQQELIHKQHETISSMIEKVHSMGAVMPQTFGGQSRQPLAGGAGGAKPKPKPSPGNLRNAACLGVIRLDYDYPPAPGDIDCPGSFSYDVYYRVVPGFTFEICQSGRCTPEVERHFVDAVKWMEGRGVSGITGDCGFMMYMQTLARSHTYLPVFMSSLCQLPAVTCAFNSHELVAVFTANGETLNPMKPLIKEECGVDPDERRFVIVGAQDVPGFEAVAAGGKVNVEKVTPGMVQLARQTLQKHPKIRAFLFECTELPPYSDAIRAEFGLPVYDSITCCDFFVNGFKDNERFGKQGWQNDWDGKQAAYSYGDNLSMESKSQLVNKVH